MRVDMDQKWLKKNDATFWMYFTRKKLKKIWRSIFPDSGLRRRNRELRDAMEEARRRIVFNINIVDNRAAYNILDMALMRDYKSEFYN